MVATNFGLIIILIGKAMLNWESRLLQGGGDVSGLKFTAVSSQAGI